MALSDKSATTRDLVNFCNYAQARGARVSEMPPFDAVTPGVHNPKSFHYDRDGKYGQAADINYGKPGTSSEERAMLAHLVTVAQSFGLGVIYALYGTQGSASAHKTHLHVDVGSWTQLGNGARRPTPGDSCVWDVQPHLHANRDNLAGPDTRKRLNAVRASSNFGGKKFPYGIRFAQDVVGTKADNKWGVQSRGAHDDTVADIQAVLKRYGYYTGRVDGIWGPLMDKGYMSFVGHYGR